MKCNKNVLLVIFASITISSLSFAMDANGNDFTPALSRKAKRRARRVAAKEAEDAAVSLQSSVNGVDKVASALDQLKDNLNKERDARNVPQLSLFGSNKLRVFAGIIVIAEAIDFAQALVKTTKEELQDKTVAQTALLIAQKTYTAKLLGAAKDGLKNRVVPGILDLKQKAQDYINKKKQTA